MIKLVFANGLNGEFGCPSGMPWPRNKQDMQDFKKITTGQMVVMGNDTFKSLGSKPLPDRDNLVLTNSLPYEGIAFDREDVMFAKVHPDAFGAFLKHLDNSIEQDVCIIGGASILIQALPYADAVCQTYVREVTEEATVKLPYKGFFEYLYDESTFARIQSKSSKDNSVVFNIYVPQVRGRF